MTTSGAPEGPRPRVLVLGSANMDVVVLAERIARPGETVLAGPPRHLPGGKGANQAVAAARTGADVTFVARTGADDLGERLRSALAAAGVDVSRVAVVPDVPTGSAFVVVDGDGENAITVSPGANATITAADLAREADLIARADLVVAQMEVPLATVVELARTCVRAGVPFLLNAAPFQALPAELLHACDHLVVNRDEAQALTGIEVGSAEDARRAGERAVALGARQVVVTLGSDGCVAVSADRVVRVAAVPVEVVDSTGAGDAFVGALAVALAHGRDLPDALVVAGAAGALTCMTTGAQSPALSATALAGVLDRTAPRVQVHPVGTG